LKDCAFLTAASPGIAEAYHAEYGLAPPQVLLNVFSRSEAPPAPTQRGRQTRPSLYWFSQTIGPERGLEWAIEAIAKSVARPDLYLRGAVGDGYERQLRDLAQRLGVATQLHLLPPIAPERLMREIADYDVSYIGETGHTPNRQIALVNKLFASLTAGLPIVASDVPAHLQIVPECQGAMTIIRRGDTAALAGLLDDWLLAPDRLARAREAAWTLGQRRFNWELEQPKFLACVDAALAQGRR
jgi:glycosyltransferase involved in cell wall biosynthesis